MRAAVQIEPLFSYQAQQIGGVRRIWTATSAHAVPSGPQQLILFRMKAEKACKCFSCSRAAGDTVMSISSTEHLKHIRSPHSFILVHFFRECPLKRCNSLYAHIRSISRMHKISNQERLHLVAFLLGDLIKRSEPK